MSLCEFILLKGIFVSRVYWSMCLSLLPMDSFCIHMSKSACPCWCTVAHTETCSPITAQIFSLASESNLQSNWSKGPKPLNKDRLKHANKLLRQGRCEVLSLFAYKVLCCKIYAEIEKYTIFEKKNSKKK